MKKKEGIYGYIVTYMVIPKRKTVSSMDVILQQMEVSSAGL